MRRPGGAPFDMVRLSVGTALQSQWDILRQDVRYALRVLRSSPQLTAVVIVTLALGIGLNSVVFSIFNGLLFRAHVSRDADTFVQIYAKPSGNYSREIHHTRYTLTLEEFDVIRDQTRTMSVVTASQWAFLTLDHIEAPAFRGKYVSCNYLSAHMRPVFLGRGLLDDDCSAPGSQPVAVLSERGWTLHFGRDPNIVGRSLRFNGRPVTVIGVVQDDQVGEPISPRVFVPFTLKPVLQPAENFFKDPPHRHAWLALSGRLAPGKTATDVQTELTEIGRSLDRSHQGQTVDLMVTNGALIREPGTARNMPLLIALCMGSAALILLIVCATVTTLLLARAMGRRHEMAVRVALGANRKRLLRQLLTESAVLALTAGAPSLALAYALPNRIVQMLTTQLIVVSLGPDWRVFGYTFGLAVLVSCVAGLSPAAESLRLHLIDTLKPAGRGDETPASSHLRKMLIADQLAISLALVIAMGLMFRAQNRVANPDIGYDSHATLATSINLERFGYSPTAARQFYDRLLPRLAAMPSVQAVALSGPAPFRGAPRILLRSSGTVENLSVSFRIVSANYFEMTGIRLLRGRFISDADSQRRGSVIPIVVSDSLARAFWPGLDGVGQRVDLPNALVGQVVGVVADTSSVGPGTSDGPMFYQPAVPQTLTNLSALVQFSGDGRPLAQAIRSEVLALDTQLLVTPETIASIVAREADRYNVVVQLTSIPSALAVFLSFVGVYGVTSFAAAQRQHEMGIRIALGARPHEIVGLLLRSTRGPFLAGVLIGLPISFVGAKLVQGANLLSEINPFDPWMFGAALLLVLSAASLATLIPALRVARTDLRQVLGSS